MSVLSSVPERLFVTGTDTGVGKTVLSLLLMRYFLECGRRPFYIKLVQTGCRTPCDADSDPRFIYRHIPAMHGKDPADSTPLCFRNPKAPFFAARDEGKEIDLRIIEAHVEQAADSFSPLVMEGAGGLMVPVTGQTNMIDLIPLLGARPVIAARAGLGTINHTLLTLEALKSRGADPLGVVFMDGGAAGTPEEMIRENIEAVERHSGVKVVGVVGKINDFSTLDAAHTRFLSGLFADRTVE